jgi:pimeloyl-ACP methyl ester carboxylesterase
MPRPFRLLRLRDRCVMRRFEAITTKRALAFAVLTLISIAFSSCSIGNAQAQHTGIRRPLVFVPGLLGSRLCRSNPTNPADPVVLWGTLRALPQFRSLRLAHTETAVAVDELKPCGLVREFVYLGVFTQRVYGPVIAYLQRLGYREGRDLFIFAYDWRRSIFENAELLAAFVRENVPDGTERIDILAHSMGGLISRVYAVKHGGAQRIATLMSAGTPFQGSVKVYQTLEKGWGSVNYMMGGLAAIRQTILSFPSLFELMPRYSACCGGDQDAVSVFTPSESAAWQSLHWEGLDTNSIPELGSIFERVRDLQNIVDSPLPPEVEDVLIIGVDQRTSQRVVFEPGSARTMLRVQTTWGGDGTVVRESATLPGRTVHPTSFATHEQILHDPQVQEFIAVALTRGVAEAMRVVKVRPRSTIRTVDGSPTQLVGVALVANEAMYQVGDKGQALVHVRLATRRELSVKRIRLSFRTPDGRESPVRLRPDPTASDPTNPFEQTFVGEFVIGARPGIGMLRAALTVDAPRPRIVERFIPILTPQ